MARQQTRTQLLHIRVHRRESPPRPAAHLHASRQQPRNLDVRVKRRIDQWSPVRTLRQQSLGRHRHHSLLSIRLPVREDLQLHPRRHQKRHAARLDLPNPNRPLNSPQSRFLCRQRPLSHQAGGLCVSGPQRRHNLRRHSVSWKSGLRCPGLCLPALHLRHFRPG